MRCCPDLTKVSHVLQAVVRDAEAYTSCCCAYDNQGKPVKPCVDEPMLEVGEQQVEAIAIELQLPHSSGRSLEAQCLWFMSG